MTELKLDLAIDSSKAVRGIKDVGEALDDVVDEFRDIDRAGDKTESSLEDNFRAIARAARKAGDDAGDDLHKGFKKGTDSLKDEARQSGAEAAASFSGDFTDGLDFAQEVAANLGPAGIAGGLIIGAIGSTALAAVEDWNEKIDGIKEATAEMWLAAAEEGAKYLDTAAIQAEAFSILNDEKFKADLEAAEKYGISRSDMAIALATGEGKVFDQVHQQFMAAKDAEAAKTQEAYDTYAQGAEGLIRLEGVHEQEIGRTITTLDEKAKATENGKKLAEEAAAVTKRLHEEERAQIDRTAKAAQDRYEAMAKRYGKPITVPVKADTSSFDETMAGLRRKNAQLLVKITGKPVATWE